MISPTSRRVCGRLGGLTTRSRNDPTAYTAAARATFAASFELEVDPDGTLPPEERAARADAARRAHYLRLAAKSAQARAGRRANPDAPPPRAE
jgi:hypothetical protein